MRLAALALLAGGLLARPAAADTLVSRLEGRAEVSGPKTEPWSRLAKGARLVEGQTVRTREKTRLELTLGDGSKVRLGSDSKLTLTEARFSGKARESVSVRLWVGQLWANVVKAARPEVRFEVRTENAIGGVRGTSFAVIAAADASAIVRVYAGSVGVRPAIGETPDRKRVPGPQEIDRKQWEEIIATAMKQVRISKLGELSPAEDFERTQDAFEKWNRGLDGR